ncbi:rho GTPase-activating protein 40 isoform X2 [Rhinichthys klamathensis goyatoka]|uniref:rho GTPase-activating protein 40 isoform X2 n=1 Tax=Rhinichthys klamathensis goyatoka TaxID=3034132 RepID=UPI0024B4BE72|nr:rho GTPase-activating protein 40 isoform X2 [Rhinichthys klamathensis goyatoka]
MLGCGDVPVRSVLALVCLHEEITGARRELYLLKNQMPWGKATGRLLRAGRTHTPAGRTHTPTGRRDCSLSAMNVESWTDPRDPQPDSPDLLKPDSLCLESFWTEVENIRSSSDSEPDSSRRRDSRQSEDGEQDELWLLDAGLSPLVTGEEEDEDKAVLLSTLTKTQAAAVQKRIDSYTLSLRKRNKTPPRHVRDVFTHPVAQSAVPETRNSESDTHRNMDSVTKTQRSAVSGQETQGLQMEEIFITDVAYCEQAAILLKQAKLPQNNSSQCRRDDGTLPRVICPQCRLGVTRVVDLSHQDLKKVRQLALIDMTALCDLLELEVKRHKTCKRKIPESCLFGVPLASLVESDQKIKPSTQIPLFLQALLSFLEKKGLDSEGILRVPGSQARIKVLQQKLENSFYSGSFVWDEVSPNDAAALMKKLIRELPAPLLTAEHLNAFSAVRDIADLKQKLHMLNLLVLLLPEPNRNTLKALLEFLSKVVCCERQNRMNLWAVSTIMAPNLFLHKAVPSKLSSGPEKGQAERAAHIMRLLIRYQDLLWTVPNFLMSQVRKLNENSSRRYQFYDKRIKNLLRKIHTDSRDKPDKHSSECRTVKIQLGDVSSSMEFRLAINSRASDLMSQFYKELHASDNSRGLLKRNGSASLPDWAIYEVGGNIGEHCLDPETHLFDLHNNNPSGEWIIKLRSASRGQ